MSIFGPKKLPELGSSLGRSITGFKKGLREAKDEIQETETPKTATETSEPAVTETQPATQNPTEETIEGAAEAGPITDKTEKS